ncbi:hypothetical protein D9615_008246 [Tricholomella constricta]|uniref:Protein CPL1-like domain-containing protein n=1 Tax=Tricholomella constricta TaxID=117010 RepID=A0A8H5H390_9AGAR|nr:hypothetical protein D9615_008246 [Tricholomella constricta]
MRFISASALVVSFFLSSAVGLNHLVERTDITSDICGEVDGVLEVPNLRLPGKLTTIGKIRSCLCISTLPYFMATNVHAITASALIGKPKTTEALTELARLNALTFMLRSHTFDRFINAPARHASIPRILSQSAYPETPAGLRARTGICYIPVFCTPLHVGHVKRDMGYGTRKQCPQGLTACGVLGRNAKSWECINTETDLESCGGCVIPLYNAQIGPEGVDCTAIPGVSDVSCVQGGCLVHRCMPGYEINATRDSCDYIEDKDPSILPARYGLEHVPL